MTDRDRLRQIIFEVAAENSAIDLAAVDEDADLYELGVDSLQFATVLVEVEERLDEELTMEAFDRLAELQKASLNSILDALVGPTGHGQGSSLP